MSSVFDHPAGTDLPVDYSAIEKSLAALWRSEKDGDDAVMRAALWNVIAHTVNATDHSHASEILARASEAVPQRSIVIRAELGAPSSISAWISANCHMAGGGKQVCSEEIAIAAGGSRVRHIPPLVNALLIPDMPVAVWWLGDVPNDDHAYVETLLHTADRLIVDSSQFDSAADLIWLKKISERTFTAPADLNWVRLEEWRVATAALFDAPSMRDRLHRIKTLQVSAGGGDTAFFGDSIESLYYAGWLNAQASPSRAGDIQYEFSVQRGDEKGAISQVKIRFDDGFEASVTRDPVRRVLNATIDGRTQTFDCVTRALGRGAHELIVRQLKRPEADAVFIRALPIAVQLAARIA